MSKITIPKLLEIKKANRKITMLTCYDYSTAQVLDETEIDIILVGDSLGMVILGYENTLPVTMGEMIHHTKAVKRGVKRAFLIADLPFMSYQVGIKEAISNAGELIKVGAEAVKLEGGEEVASTIEALVKAEISVMGHIGLTPQSIHKFGGYKVQGRDKRMEEKIRHDAKVLSQAGVFSIVLECIPFNLAKDITKELDIPTISCGAGPYCDGQVLVINDLLGFYEKVPRFVRRYVDLRSVILKAVDEYIKDVRECKFPSLDESYK
ncbi:MAG: 3-methyl-2-oxobutanoate hydroxymethyltransferase [bacterium]|nr:3-methyl-2-oxobutanoate hydroxymethyltransferase [bacterium]